MDKRRSELSKISSYIQGIDSEVTMILQSLQWDHTHLIKGLPMAVCKYERSHSVPPDRLDVHEKDCRLRSLGYSGDQHLLPEPVVANADTLVTLNKEDITNIIDYASKIDPLFRKGRAPPENPPLSLARLQAAYSADERRAIHDAVVSAAPAPRDLLEFVLPGSSGPAAASRPARAALLAELRDLKRRRARYRGTSTRSYCDELRDLIATQMELYSGAQAAVATAQSKETNISHHQQTAGTKRYEEVHIKKEPDEEATPNFRGHEKSRSARDKDADKEREKRHDDYKRDKHRVEKDRYMSSSKDKSRDRRDYGSRERYRKDEEGDSGYSRKRESRDSSGSSRHEYSRRRHDRDEHRHEPRERSRAQGRHPRYYDLKQDNFEDGKKGIKREKD